MSIGIETLRPLALAGLVLTLGACGTFGKGEPTRGDLMIAEGKAVADLGEMWNEGREMVDRAGSLAAEGARLKQQGRHNLAKGQEITRHAKTVVEQQQQEYARFAETVGPLVTLQTAREQRDHLDRVVEKWRDGWKRLQKGRELVEKGRSQIEAGEAKIAEADAMRYRGQTLMRRAEQAYSSEAPVPAVEGGR